MNKILLKWFVLYPIIGGVGLTVANTIPFISIISTFLVIPVLTLLPQSLVDSFQEEFLKNSEHVAISAVGTEYLSIEGLLFYFTLFVAVSFMFCAGLFLIRLLTSWLSGKEFRSSF